MKEIIREKAIQMFKKNGYDNTNILDICHECGISKTTFYYHFKSKSEILSTLFDNSVLIDKVNFSNAMFEESYVEKMWAMLCVYIDYVVENGSDLLKQIYKSNMDENLGTFRHELYGKVNDILERLVKEAQNNGEIRNMSDHKRLVKGIFYFISGIGLIWSIENGSFDEKEEIKKQVFSMLDVLPKR